jgi:CMP-N,N'-diacetyllegionaminic acid synthase
MKPFPGKQMNNSKIDDGIAIGLIPARGGSKSIPLKNIARICDRPMISYVIEAGKKALSLSGLYCSTDHEDIAKVCIDAGVEVIERPEDLGRDDTPVTDVIKHVLKHLGDREGIIPGMVALLQPTSPFVTPGHIDKCVNLLRENDRADSSQTVTPVLHNCHAYNQRIIDDGYVKFRYLKERRTAYNKQLKPKHYLFGNLVVSRSRSLLSGKDCFGDISIPIVIPRAFALDVDTKDDLDYASYLVRENKFFQEVE